MKQLVFNQHGGVQLLASEQQAAKILWSSDDDEEFSDEVEGDTFDPDDDDDIDTIADYLIEKELLNDGEDFDVVDNGPSEAMDTEDDEFEEGEYDE